MAMSQQEIGELVFAAFPQSFRRRLVQGAYAAHQSAEDEAYRTFADTEAKNVVGNLRRGYIETNLRGAAELDDALTAEVKRIPGTGWNYTEVRSSGDGAVLVAKSVTTPGAMIDQADYRETLAEKNQLALWDEVEQVDEAPLFVVLIHSRYSVVAPSSDRDIRGLLGSAYLVCPLPESKHYLWEWNLVKEFPDVVEANLPQSWNEVAKLRYVRYSESALYKKA